MRVLILGSGGREHAISWKFSQSKRISGLYIAPGNGGTAELGTNLNINPEKEDQVLQACRDNKIDLVFVGPEGPLAAGIVDKIKEAGIAVIGPHQEAAQLESSKAFSKDFMVRNHIPTAESRTFTKASDFESYMKSITHRVVLKKSGLAAGKGVLESTDQEELLHFGKEVLKTDSLVVEEFLEGFEVSFFVLSDGKNYRVLPPCSDYKKAHDNDEGLNTGGMGAICPVPWVTKELYSEIEQSIIKTTMDSLNKEGLNYVGVVYIGVMVTSKGPKVLEYNVRFGDPETQPLLSLIESDFGNIADAMIKGHLDNYTPRVNENNTALGVVIAAEGYPGEYNKSIPVQPIPEDTEDALIFHASTSIDAQGQLVTGGGRCFTSVGIGSDIISAYSAAYRGTKFVNFEGAWFRNDIGKKFYEEA
ncbi:phosphoribosylamine--glycine ligase [Spirochaeta cellobiosiphila]|uniref:phosphoribosylamine--glycine ligase n=1 Tax=Spirochaeta cellobiosiphila TaxID=504483 RepID=UPI00041A9CCC|nr:phosphoribosylamine--glycine ligase [Spirochaeta cellobiosiphila]